MIEIIDMQDKPEEVYEFIKSLPEAEQEIAFQAAAVMRGWENE